LGLHAYYLTRAAKKIILSGMFFFNGRELKKYRLRYTHGKFECIGNEFMEKYRIAAEEQ